MQTQSQNNRRIAKNTLFLYVRMLLIMGVSLYTSRVVLNALGIEDFGIYNVVGGVVAMFSSISITLSIAVSRFITFELGKGDQSRLNRLFSTSVVMQIIMGVALAIIIEGVGVWLISDKLVIPPDRLMAAKCILHLSVISLFVEIISVPYNATIIAHEHMKAFAYIGIFEAVAKLSIAYILIIVPIDRLILYSILMVGVSIVIRLIYGLYCSRNFEECRGIKLIFDRKILKEMFGFAGWNSIGVLSYMLREHGVNILLNISFGPIVNAARGITTQVSGSATKFTQNFMVALNPQIIKSYANDDRDRMMNLVFKGSRLSYYMMLFISLPIVLCTNYILTLWLGSVPEYTVSFIRLSIVHITIEMLSVPLTTLIQATGNIRNFQIADGCVKLMNLPICYILLSLNRGADSVFVVSIILAVISLFVKLYILRGQVGLQVGSFTTRVIFNVISVSAVALVAPYIVSLQMTESTTRFVIVSLIALLSTAISIYFIGCDKGEQEFLSSKIRLVYSYI